MFGNRLIEIFLIQLVGYLLLWIADEYMATLLSILFMVIFGAILIVSFIVEVIEPSKVPRLYFVFMITAIAAPLLAGGIYLGIMGGELGWLYGE